MNSFTEKPRIKVKVAKVAASDMSILFLLYPQIKHLQQKGYDVEAICAEGKWIDKIKSLDIPVITIDMEREISPLKDLKTLFALISLFRKRKYLIVNTHTPKAGILGPLAAKLAGVPVVIHTVHGFLFHDKTPLPGALLYWSVEKFTALFSDYLFFQSKEDIENAVRYRIGKKDKLFYIGNGINLRRFDPETLLIERKAKRKEIGLSDNDFVIGTVGRLVYEKGFKEFFEVIRILIDKVENIKFLIIGPEEINQKDAIRREEIEELRKTGKAFFLGMRNDLSELYSTMDLFVLLTHREGIPRALMEASAMKVPCIATDIRGCREVIKDGITGFLVPVNDPVAAAEKIEQITADRKNLTEIGECARRHIEDNFDEAVVNKRVEAAYHEILGRKKL